MFMIIEKSPVILKVGVQLGPVFQSVHLHFSDKTNFCGQKEWLHLIVSQNLSPKNYDRIIPADLIFDKVDRFNETEHLALEMMWR